MSYQFTVTVEVMKTSGPFASRSDIEDELRQAIEDADPSSISPADSEYDTTDWSVEVAESKPKGKAKSQDREWLDTLHEMLGNAPTLASDDFLTRAHGALGRYLAK